VVNKDDEFVKVEFVTFYEIIKNMPYERFFSGIHAGFIPKTSV